MGLITPKPVTGQNLHKSFVETVADLTEQAQNRSDVVNERIAALEEEIADLRQLQRKLGAARGTA